MAEARGTGPQRPAGDEKVSFSGEDPSLPCPAFAMVSAYASVRVTTDAGPGRPGRRRRSSRSRRPKVLPEGVPASLIEPAGPPAVAEPMVTEPVGDLPVTSVPEPSFAARVMPPLPRPAPATRRAIFFDVENTSRAEHIARVLSHLAIDWTGCASEVIAVGNWRVIGHETARLLARHGAHLVHSAPSVGVRDWSDLRIAVGAGVWLAGARAGDQIEIVSDDQAFDAVGDVAASLGVTFRRLSYRALAGVLGDLPREEPARESRPPRRRRRGGRRSGGRTNVPATVAVERAVANGGEPEVEGHTAPHDEIVDVVRHLLGASRDGGVSIDALSNALKARGFSRPPGSPRLITRLRRIKELEVSRNGTIRLVASSGEAEPSGGSAEAGEGTAEESPPAGDAPASAPPRRRRRRGGRRRRGRGGGQAAVATP